VSLHLPGSQYTTCVDKDSCFLGIHRRQDAPPSELRCSTRGRERCVGNSLNVAPLIRPITCLLIVLTPGLVTGSLYLLCRVGKRRVGGVQ